MILAAKEALKSSRDGDRPSLVVPSGNDKHEPIMHRLDHIVQLISARSVEALDKSKDASEITPMALNIATITQIAASVKNGLTSHFTSPTAMLNKLEEINTCLKQIPTSANNGHNIDYGRAEMMTIIDKLGGMQDTLDELRRGSQDAVRGDMRAGTDQRQMQQQEHNVEDGERVVAGGSVQAGEPVSSTLLLIHYRHDYVVGEGDGFAQLPVLPNPVASLNDLLGSPPGKFRTVCVPIELSLTGLLTTGANPGRAIPRWKGKTPVRGENNPCEHHISKLSPVHITDIMRILLVLVPTTPSAASPAERKRKRNDDGDGEPGEGEDTTQPNERPRDNNDRPSPPKVRRIGPDDDMNYLSPTRGSTARTGSAPARPWREQIRQQELNNRNDYGARRSSGGGASSSYGGLRVNSHGHLIEVKGGRGV